MPAQRCHLPAAVLPASAAHGCQDVRRQPQACQHLPATQLTAFAGLDTSPSRCQREDELAAVGGFEKGCHWAVHGSAASSDGALKPQTSVQAALFYTLYFLDEATKQPHDTPIIQHHLGFQVRVHSIEMLWPASRAGQADCKDTMSALLPRSILSPFKKSSGSSRTPCK